MWHSSSHSDWRFSVRFPTQLGAGAILILVFVASAAATVQAPQASSSIRSVQASPSRTTSPTATGSATRVLPARTARAVVAPHAVPGQTQVDANTLALYHFDAPNIVAVDATGNYTGTLIGNAAILDSGLYNGVLSADGNGAYVDTGNLGNIISGTIEGFVDFQPVCNGGAANFAIFSAIDGGSGQTVLYVGVDGDNANLNYPGETTNAVAHLIFWIYANGQWHWAESGINVCRYLAGASGPAWPYETWRFHQVAATWGSRGMEIWVDGVLHGVGVLAPNTRTEPYPYKCNPQAQLGIANYPPNPLYPVCRTPVAAPQTTPSPPPGDYFGTFGPYTTFRIGCDSVGKCFKGRIDEVRISNIQRTFEWTVVPTVTPTPTWTPVSSSGEYAVDAYTRALYHLNSAPGNSVLEEVSQTYKGLSNASVVPNGKLNAGLNVNGDYSSVLLGNHGPLIQGTIEAWVNYSSAGAMRPIMFVPKDYNSNQPLLFFGTTSASSVGFAVFNGAGTYWVDSGVAASSLVGCWHHLAGTWGPRGLEIWVDGTLRQTDPSMTGTMPYSNPY
ncbi:MAG: LamG domain-containing protein, partial [Anaerolineales bacterium]|nr:LamG domain-containing protein [Anaerolineales bacterium]